MKIAFHTHWFNFPNRGFDFGVTIVHSMLVSKPK